MRFLSLLNIQIAVASGKGGVGKSTVAAYLARSLTKRGKKVGVLDADIYGPSIRHMLPEDVMPIMEENRLVPAKSQEISLMSPSFFQGAEQGFFVRAPVIHKWIQYFCKETDFSDRDLVLYDLPPGTGDIQMTLCQMVPLSGVILVTTPQELVQLDVRKAYHLFLEMKVPIFGIVENMSYLSEAGQKIFPFGEGGGRKLSDQLGIPFLGQIPLEREVSLASDEGRSLTGGEASLAFDLLAETILNRVEI